MSAQDIFKICNKDKSHTLNFEAVGMVVVLLFKNALHAIPKFITVFEILDLEHTMILTLLLGKLGPNGLIEFQRAKKTVPCMPDDFQISLKRFY